MTDDLFIGQQWVYQDFEPQRIDVFLVEQLPQYSRTQIQLWLKQGCFKHNDKTGSKNNVLKRQDIVAVLTLPTLKPSYLTPQNIALDIVYEDSDLIVINKPKNLVVHPGSGNTQDTLANGLVYHFEHLSGVQGELRPGIVHRLDKDTSGLMVAAKNDETHRHLATQIEKRTAKRVYWAIVWKKPEQSGTIDRGIKRHPHQKTKMSVNSMGKPAITYYRVLEYFNFASLLEFRLETGRTHQIRVHASSISHPVVGDELYENQKFNVKELSSDEQNMARQFRKIFSSQALHSKSLEFVHPRTQEKLSFEINTHPEMQKGLEFLRRNVS